jgi:histidinol-phosphate aminotransferase
MRSLELSNREDRGWLEALRRQEFSRGAIATKVTEILETVRREGDAAVRTLTRLHDGVGREALRLSEEELDRLAGACEPALLEVLRTAAANIRAFHAPQLPQGYTVARGRLEHRVVPLRAVGLYVPGGRAAYPSTVLMNVIPAAIAGVKRICVATPPRPGPEAVSPAVAAACQLAGATDVFLMGGAQAVAAFAYGTQTVPRVDKICGPGNVWVTEAKRQVGGQVGIDMLAGPSELLVLDDGRADPNHIAYDIVAQAEHDPLAVTLCVTTSRTTWQALPTVLRSLLSREPNPVAAESTRERSAVVLAETLAEAIAFANEFAPEHLELATAPDIAEQLWGAAAVFVGDCSPTPIGDYMVGPNHTLPTAGSAAFSSPLGVYDFVRRVNIIRWSEADLAAHGPAVARFARAEGLIGHARTIEIRLAEKSCPRSERNADPADFILPAVRRQEAYQLTAPPDAPIKLNQNEAPFDLPVATKEHLLARFRNLDWRRYPPFDPASLKAAIARADGWRADGVLVGNGSNELLTLLIRSVLGPRDAVVRSEPCFSLYPLHLDVAGARQIAVPLELSRDYAYDESALIEAAQNAKVLLLASPNNPTGSVLSRASLERLLLSQTDTLVVVDEAYREWCGQDFAPLLGVDVPLVLLRTYSKSQALAGLRFGYLLGPPTLCAELAKVILPYAVNSLTQAAVVDLLGHPELVRERVAQVIVERSRLSARLRAKGRRVIEGGANFVLVSSSDPRAEFTRLLAAGVLVRDLSRAVPGFLRVSVGTSTETDCLLELI